MLCEKDLTGVWRLKDLFYLEDDGSTSEGPLGPRAAGLLIYHADGYMAASLMRTESLTGQGGSPQETYLGSADDYLGYSGRWHLRGEVVVHQVVIGSHQRVVNTEQVRDVRMHDGVLRLQRRLGGPHAYVVMDWRRI
ncbi:lipocalin-like domain-containing protein [Streptomyces inhibens]|uniref:lipocalin-like domain-containing protein n=1 Tax=Streptomyces inhibens TaxID=2293571 RepID=UPI0036B13A22